MAVVVEACQLAIALCVTALLPTREGSVLTVSDFSYSVMAMACIPWLVPSMSSPISLSEAA